MRAADSLSWVRVFCLVSQLIFSFGVAQASDLVGQMVPACALKPFRVNGRSVLHHPGHVTYLDFWASWCGPCRQSFPFMNKLHKDLGGKGLDVIGINLDEKSEEALGFLKESPAQFELLKDEGGQCAKLFDVKAMPSTYLIDEKGVIRRIHLGFKMSEAGTVRKQVEDLLGKKP